jgi:hypothetical protein
MSSVELRTFLKKKIKKDIDLLLDPMLEIIPGNSGEVKEKHRRLPNLKENIKDAKLAFIGKPIVCHELVKSIIHLRREIDTDCHKDRFYFLLEKYQDILIKELDLRWLVSVCDTIVDTGNDIDSSSAMLVVVIVNGLNIQATLLDSVSAEQPTSDQIENTPYRPTWDGMISAYVKGDMMFNMMTRLEKVVSRSLLVSIIWQEIKSRLRDDPTVPVNWLANAHSNEHFRKFFR